MRLKVVSRNFGLVTLTRDVPFDVEEPFDSTPVTAFVQAEFLRVFTNRLNLGADWQQTFQAEVHVIQFLGSARLWESLRSHSSVSRFIEMGGEFHISLRSKSSGEEITPLKLHALHCLPSISFNSDEQSPLAHAGSTPTSLPSRSYHELALEGWWRFKGFSKTYFVSRHYLCCYIAYLSVVITITTVLLWLTSDTLNIWEALFMAVSSASMTGLSVIDFSRTCFLFQFILWVHILLSSPMLLTVVPVVLRLRSFHRQVRFELRGHSVRGCQLVDGELTALEASALSRLRLIVLCYWAGCQFSGWILLWVPIALRAHGVHNSWTSAAWPALFLSTSAFNNCGLTTLRQGLPSENESEAISSLAISVIGILILAGNTCFPIFLRLILHGARARGSSPELDFLMRNPRRCYTHLFPAYATRWLGITVIVLIVAQIIAVYCVDAHPALFGASSGIFRIIEVLFFAISTRTAGFAIHPLNVISPSTSFVMCVCMWISTSPVVVAIRSTRETMPGRALHGIDNYDLGGAHRHVEYKDEAHLRSPRHQLMVFMSENSVALVLLFFGILAFEKQQFDGNPDTRGGARRADNFLVMLFEFCSAWGTVGLSMAATPWSASGDWSVGAQLCLMMVMFLGRLRGLPESIDPSVSFISAESGKRPSQQEVGERTDIPNDGPRRISSMVQDIMREGSHVQQPMDTA